MLLDNDLKATILTFPFPSKQKPISFDILRESKPGSVLLEHLKDRPPKNLQDGEICLLVLC